MTEEMLAEVIERAGRRLVDGWREQEADLTSWDVFAVLSAAMKYVLDSVEVEDAVLMATQLRGSLDRMLRATAALETTRH